MKVEILQEKLVKGVGLVSRVVSSRPQIPILGNILVVADSLGLHLSGGDGEIFVKTTVGAKVIKDGSICLPARTFSELVSSLGPGKIELSSEKNNLSIVSDSFKGRMNGQDASEFPRSDQDKESSTLKMGTEAVKSSFSKVVFSAALDTSRPALAGVLFRKTPKGLQLVATDAFRLSLVNLNLETKEFTDLIVPAKVLSEVLRMQADLKDDSVKIVLSPSQIGFKFEGGEIFSRVIAGNYPAFEKIIPKESQLQVIVSKNSLEKAVKTAAIFARDSSNIIRIKLKPELELLTVLSSSPTGEQEQELPAKLEGKLGEELSVAFNYRYFLDLLSNTSSEEIVMELNGPLSAAVFRLPNDPGFLHLIMPVRVQN